MGASRSAPGLTSVAVVWSTSSALGAAAFGSGGVDNSVQLGVQCCGTSGDTWTCMHTLRSFNALRSILMQAGVREANRELPRVSTASTHFAMCRTSRAKTHDECANLCSDWLENVVCGDDPRSASALGLFLHLGYLSNVIHEDLLVEQSDAGCMKRQPSPGLQFARRRLAWAMTLHPRLVSDAVDFDDADLVALIGSCIKPLGFTQATTGCVIISFSDEPFPVGHRDRMLPSDFNLGGTVVTQVISTWPNHVVPREGTAVCADHMMRCGVHRAVFRVAVAQLRDGDDESDQFVPAVQVGLGVTVGVCHSSYDPNRRFDSSYSWVNPNRGFDSCYLAAESPYGWGFSCSDGCARHAGGQCPNLVPCTCGLDGGNAAAPVHSTGCPHASPKWERVVRDGDELMLIMDANTGTLDVHKRGLATSLHVARIMIRSETGLGSGGLHWFASVHRVSQRSGPVRVTLEV